MQLFYHPSNPDSKCNWVMDALAEGWPYARVGDRKNCDVKEDGAFWGFIDNNSSLMMNYALTRYGESDKADFYFWDMGYWNRYSRYTDDPCYWRVSRNSFHRELAKSLPSDRFEQWGVTLKPFREGDYILLLPSSETMTNVYCGQSVDTWIKAVTLTVSQHTKRDFKIRYKPRANGTSGPDALKPGEPTLKDDLAGAHCVITPCSMGAVEALIEGVPVLGRGFLREYFNVDILHDLVDRMLTEIQDIELRRKTLLNTLAYSQYTLDEIRSGEAFSTIMRWNI